MIVIQHYENTLVRIKALYSGVRKSVYQYYWIVIIGTLICEHYLNVVAGLDDNFISFINLLGGFGYNSAKDSIK